MNFRDRLKTDLGRTLFDYSPIRKSKISKEVLEDLSSSFFKREEIEDYSRIDVDEGLYIFLIPDTTSLSLYSKWRDAFFEHGYTPPILSFIDLTDDAKHD